MSYSLRPIGSWPLVAVLAIAVMGVTLWIYRQKLRTSSGRWRWVALALRVAAVLLCILAALRPSLLIDQKMKDASVVLLLIDSSGSMIIADEAGGKTRWAAAREALDSAKKALDGRPNKELLEVKVLRFDKELRDDRPDDVKPPDGRQTELGSVMLKAAKDQQGKRVSSMVVIGDGASNGGISPLVAAQQLKGQVPVVTVGVGQANAGKESPDIAARDLVAGPTVFVKNQPEISGTLAVRGFADQPIEVELLAEGESRPVATKTIKVPEGAQAVTVSGFKYIPTTVGEKRLTLRVKPRPNELVATNNEISTYLDVLKGGLKVLYIQGPGFSWEPKYLVRGLDAAREIHADLRVLREPARGDKSLIEDAEFAPGQYDVYVLSNLPADHLTRRQIALLAGAVDKGAGLIMLGGDRSFGPGGWGNTEIGRLLPVQVSGSDGQIDPGDDGLKVVPDALGLENYVLRLAPTPAENARVWAALPPITGANRFGPPRAGAFVLAKAGRDPLMIAQDAAGKGRVIAFGGETWPWARATDEGRVAHAKFWRQAILWLARKEDAGESRVDLKLDARRVSAGQKLDLTASARDARNEPIPDAQFESTVTRLSASGQPEGKPEAVPFYLQGDDAKGAYFAGGQPGEYLVEVKGTRGGQPIGSASARFMVYQDDRELENPAADPALLRQIAEITGGASLRAEELEKHLKDLGPEAAESVHQTEHRLWDNWTFFLIYAGLLCAEWGLRKAKGWV
ncbi:glutamine amidotransferase [Tundrisphaera sp. TA3]|uniref:glutamine amidotransferase n=1 Tax=Tundrisphaera sp. TA3 TaxID=3435775 RepID=UPI003EBDC06D